MSILVNNSLKSQKTHFSDDDFPPILKFIDKPPKQLFWAGAPPISWLDKPKVAIVGSRKASSYGRWVTQALAADLAKRGVVIISGLALGIDSIAHRQALAGSGLTVAVLPTPLSQIYPASHASLANDIVAKGGCLLSEYPSSSEVYKINFVARNRIVSGLADVLLITEAAAASGTMHTARFALTQGKTVMAVPGNINQPGSEGTNNLIKSGAIPVTDAGDILFALGLPTEPRRTIEPNLSGRQTEIIRLLISGLSDQEGLAQAAGLQPEELNSELTMMEIAGLIRPLGAGRWTAA